MTCVEAAKALVREARRVRAGEPGKGGAGGGGADGGVTGLPEVAWLTIAGKSTRHKDKQEEGREAEPVFVHHRSMKELLGSKNI